MNNLSNYAEYQKFTKYTCQHNRKIFLCNNIEINPQKIVSIVNAKFNEYQNTINAIDSNRHEIKNLQSEEANISSEIASLYKFKQELSQKLSSLESGSIEKNQTLE